MATKWIFSLIPAAAILLVPFIVQGAGRTRVVKKGGMVLEMRYRGKFLECRLSAPGTGWLAMGFNPGRGLTGTNLIMGRVVGGKVEISDRTVVRPGLHRPISEMGGRDLLREKQGRRIAGGSRTEISFLIPGEGGRFHHELVPGKKFEILLAYSTDRDFMHHSIMRTAVIVPLPLTKSRPDNP